MVLFKTFLCFIELYSGLSLLTAIMKLHFYFICCLLLLNAVSMGQAGVSRGKTGESGEDAIFAENLVSDVQEG